MVQVGSLDHQSEGKTLSADQQNKGMAEQAIEEHVPGHLQIRIPFPSDDPGKHRIERPDHDRKQCKHITLGVESHLFGTGERQQDYARHGERQPYEIVFSQLLFLQEQVRGKQCEKRRCSNDDPYIARTGEEQSSVFEEVVEENAAKACQCNQQPVPSLCIDQRLVIDEGQHQQAECGAYHKDL